MTSQFVEELAAKIVERFSCFGGGKSNDWNPISIALKDRPAQFAAGVDVRSVIEFVLSEYETYNYNN